MYRYNNNNKNSNNNNNNNNDDDDVVTKANTIRKISNLLKLQGNPTNKQTCQQKNIETNRFIQKPATNLYKTNITNEIEKYCFVLLLLQKSISVVSVRCLCNQPFMLHILVF